MILPAIARGAHSLSSIVGSPKTIAADATSSFAAKLAAVLEEFLDESGGGSKVEVDVKVPDSQVSGTRQFVVTVSGLTGKETPGPISAPLPDPAPNSRLADGRPVTNAYEAYWASQPPEVQALMSLRTEAERMTLAQELADKGFIIDVPIMIWDWDPLATMVVRRNQGFTWVPSAKMEPVRVAPGLSFPGLPSYDPQNPPPGAIMVSTEFAKGLEHTCPWLRHEDWQSI